MHTKLWLQNRKGRYLEDIYVNVRIILKCIIKKLEWKVDDRFLNIGSGSGFLRTR